VTAAVSALSAADTLALWEEGGGRTPLEWALAVLERVGSPAADTWPVGRRDGVLVDVLEASFGDRIAGTVACPECGETLELEFPVDAMRAPAAVDRELRLELETALVVARLPTSADVRAAAGVDDLAAAGRALARRCVVRAEDGGAPVGVDELPTEALEAVAQAAADADQQAAVTLELACPECGCEWPLPFDPADYLRRLVEASARELVDDVHALASAYGWSEDEILSLPERRRGLYLDLLGR